MREILNVSPIKEGRPEELRDIGTLFTLEPSDAKNLHGVEYARKLYDILTRATPSEIETLKLKYGELSYIKNRLKVYTCAGGTVTQEECGRMFPTTP